MLQGGEEKDDADDKECTDELYEELKVTPSMTICAKRGGLNYLETQRIDLETGYCPHGLVPCSYKTSASDTICVKEFEKPD